MGSHSEEIRHCSHQCAICKGLVRETYIYHGTESHEMWTYSEEHVRVDNGGIRVIEKAPLSWWPDRVGPFFFCEKCAKKKVEIKRVCREAVIELYKTKIHCLERNIRSKKGKIKEAEKELAKDINLKKKMEIYIEKWER